MQLPPFNDAGCLPVGDYSMTFAQLRESMLVLGPGDPSACPTWDAAWRHQLVESAEVLVGELWEVGVRNVFLDGSFVEDKDHPNDIDGYFECSIEQLKTGDLESSLNQVSQTKAMIRNESEYQEASRRLSDEKLRVDALMAKLRDDGEDADAIMRLTDPLVSFHLQLREEVESYERLRRGQFSEIHNLHGLGRLLIGLRIARDMSQRELAEKLDVHESQVSRDERNEYHGITIQRAAKILDVLGARLTTQVELDIDVHEERAPYVDGP